MTAPVYTLPTPLAQTAQTILDAAGAALDASGILKFNYRLIVPGREVPVEECGILAVAYRTAHPGRIGNQQFTGQTPGQATWPQNVFAFSCEVWGCVPQPTVGAVSGYKPPSKASMDVSALDLLDAGWVIMAALESEQFANELFPYKPALIGPLDPVGPQGAMVGLALSVQLQLP